METLYRKVAVSVRLPNDSGYYFGIDSLGNREYPYFDKEENEWTSIWETTHWLEEIPDNSHQIEKLQSDKAELLEALEEVKMGIFQMSFDQLELLYPEIESLIQKHKQ